MTTKKLNILAIALLAVIVLGACSPGYGDPEAASESFFAAFEAQDENAINDSVCEALQDGRLLLDTDDDDEFEIEFNFDLRFVVDEENDDNATVHAFGTTRYRVETDVEDVDFRRHSKEDTELFSVQLTKDGDDWKVCDDGFIFQILGVAPTTLGETNDPTLENTPPPADTGTDTDDTTNSNDTETNE